ncbi:hypothetical protein [Qipengyuania sp. 902]|uniref:hypothetical protein n=1 Tax=Qipengyuania sp. 902 TaxID=3417565 RepID=UPI003EB78AF1
MRMVVLAGAMVLVAACSNPDENSSEVVETTEVGEPVAAAEDTSLPGDFAETAWRITSEDGARYTTYLDRDGSYRDLRNGDLWQEGQWTFNATGDERLCFTPNEENGVERCWNPESMTDDMMDATGPQDRRIELQRVDYRLPDESSTEDE